MCSARPDGWVVSAERVEPELREFTRESVFRLLAVADEIMAALKDADRQTQTSRPREVSASLKRSGHATLSARFDRG